MSQLSLLPIVPTPQSEQIFNGHFQFSPDVVISGPLDNNSRALQTFLRAQLNLEIPVEPSSKTGKNVIRFLPLRKGIGKKSLPKKYSQDLFEKEGYLLEISEREITLSSHSAAGAFYGVQSLQFLIQSRQRPHAIRCCKIIDWPDFEMRGVTDDISRGQVSTMDNFKKIIRFIAHYKMNVYMPYLEDMFRFKNYPSIGKNRGALTAEECVELQEYAGNYHVEIIPIFQTLGHWENLLFTDEYVHLADFPGSASLNAVSEETYQFLENLLEEIAPVFKSVYFHIGADESFDVGRGATGKAAQRHGIATVHARHYKRVIEIVKKYNKQIMMYGDIVLKYPSILNEIPRELILFDWHYEAEDHYPSTEVFRKAGQPFIVSPGVQNWSRIFPDLSIALANIKQFTLDGYTHGAVGAITSNWGDFSGANFRELCYYPYAFAADMAWNTNGTPALEFEKRFFRDFCGAESSSFASVYHLLSKMSEYYDIDHFFAHPFYSIEDNLEKTIIKSFELSYFAQQLIREIDHLRLLTSNNQDHLDVLELCAEMYRWIGRLMDAKLAMNRIRKYDFENPDRRNLAASLQKKLIECKGELDNIQTSYQRLWLRSNRPDNLNIILGLMERVSRLLELKAQEIGEGNLEFNGRLETAFISHPAATKAGVKSIWLRKAIELKKRPQVAWLQIIANSHATIRVNGNEIGHLIARRSLSGVAEQWRVKVWHVGEWLNPGKNVIAIRVDNYVPGESASANVWFECPDEPLIITSDEHWKAINREEEKWSSPDYDDSYWVSAVPVANNWIVSRPYLKQGIASRIEFFSATVDF